jgi:hypothetical protein
MTAVRGTGSRPCVRLRNHTATQKSQKRNPSLECISRQRLYGLGDRKAVEKRWISWTPHGHP